MKLRRFLAHGDDTMSCVMCCFLDNKVHPLENVLDANDMSLDRSHMTSMETLYDSSQVKDKHTVYLISTAYQIKDL